MDDIKASQVVLSAPWCWVAFSPQQLKAAALKEDVIFDQLEKQTRRPSLFIPVAPCLRENASRRSRVDPRGGRSNTGRVFRTFSTSLCSTRLLHQGRGAVPWLEEVQLPREPPDGCCRGDLERGPPLPQATPSNHQRARLQRELQGRHRQVVRPTGGDRRGRRGHGDV